MTRFHIYICYISDDVTQKLITTEYFNSYLTSYALQDLVL